MGSNYPVLRSHICLRLVCGHTDEESTHPKQMFREDSGRIHLCMKLLNAAVVSTKCLGFKWTLGEGQRRSALSHNYETVYVMQISESMHNLNLFPHWMVAVPYPGVLNAMGLINP